MALSIATFNVKNLVEPASDHARAVWPDKLATIARMIDACDADVIGLQEIGSATLLAQVLDRLARLARPAQSCRYCDPILGTVDPRGIGCAVLSRLKVQSSRVHTCAALPFPVFREGDPAPFGARLPLRRGVVHVRVDAADLGSVDVLVAHFKSPRPVPARDRSGAEVPPTTARERSEGQLRGMIWRAAEALFVRGCVDDVLAGRPDASVAVVGDLNDTIDAWPVRALAGQGAGALFDASAGIPASAKYSCLHEGRRSQIDHVLVTAPLRARIRDARFCNQELREHPLLPDSGVEVETADSDHAPLVVCFS